MTSAGWLLRVASVSQGHLFASCCVKGKKTPVPVERHRGEPGHAGTGMNWETRASAQAPRSPPSTVSNPRKLIFWLSFGLFC